MRDAEISDCGLYRYLLTRRWGEKPRSVTWVMLNPSTADAEIDDPTIRRCVGFTKRFGYESLAVVNLFAFRATDPKCLLKAPDPIGPRNAYWIQSACNRSDLVVGAWGAFAKKCGAPVNTVAKIIRESGSAMKCLGTTKDGSPRHPLYVRGDAELVDWKGAA